MSDLDHQYAVRFEMLRRFTHNDANVIKAIGATG